MTCRPGLLVMIPFPYADLPVSKKRPVLVLTAPDRHGDFIGMAVTSVPTEENAIHLDPAVLVQGALPLPSWVRLDKLYTLDADAITRELAQVHPDFLERVVRGSCAIIGQAGDKIVVSS